MFMKSNALKPKEYIEEQEESRAKELRKIRALVRRSLPKGYKEVMRYGMISYDVPEGRNGKQLVSVSLASQKGYMALYFSNIYEGNKGEDKFRKLYTDGGKKLNMGKSCLRFKTVDDLDTTFLEKLLANKLATPF